MARLTALALLSMAAIIPTSSAAAASPPVGASTSAAPVPQHKLAPLCSTITEPGRARCFAIQQSDTVQPAGVSADAVSPQTAPAGYGPSTLVAAYKLDQSKGIGQVVAVVDAYDDPNAESDLAVYRTQYGLPACTTANGCFAKVSQTGSTTNLPVANQPGWAAEISLDLDMVSATCPNCHVLLVEATDNHLSNLAAAVNEAVTLGAKYVSNSYGGPEDAGDAAYDSAYFHPGVAITASSGDSGYGPQYPATSTHVTAVGGTSLTPANNARGWTESVWSTDSTAGTGSGCSAYVTKPLFQTNVSTGCTSRAETDVSAVADPNTGMAVFDTYQAQGWRVFGGTSASSPIIASIYALAGPPNASDSPNTYPYSHASSLFDVTSGFNGTCSPAVLCTAGAGWDGPTGLGTPNGSAAFTGSNTVRVTNPGAQSSQAGSPLNLQIQASDSVTATPLTYAALGLPPGLVIDAGTGLISGTPTDVANYTVTVTATDGTSASGSTTFTWVIQAPGMFRALAPYRLLDTRFGNGAAQVAVAAFGTVHLQVAGRGGVPASGVSAAALNVTVTDPVDNGYVTVYGDGTALPTTSNLNFLAGQTVPNMVIAPIGTNGVVDLYNGSAGTIHLVADVSGYTLSGAPVQPGAYGALAPYRLLDTRFGNGAAQVAVAAFGTVHLQVAGRGGVPASGVSAAALNVTVTDPVDNGYVTVYGDGTALPTTSNLNFLAGQTVPNMVIAPIGTNGVVDLYNGSAGTIHLVADISGYFLG
ncbi:MAG: putative Ig domain-containing protein [Cellulomonas sp.]